MECFCISLRLDVDSHSSLEPLTSSLRENAHRRCSFLHTTILQGVTPSLQSLYELLLSSDIFLQHSSLKNQLLRWDRLSKRCNPLYREPYDAKWDAIILPYRHSNLLRKIASQLTELIQRAGLLVYLEEVDHCLLPAMLPANFRYAFDFPFNAQFGIISPHTTLGFCHPEDKCLETVSDLWSREDWESLQINHEAVYLTNLDEFCMTPSLNRLLIFKVQ